MRAKIEATLAAAITRKDAFVARNAELQQQAIALNAAGVEIERAVLVVEGEIRALTDLLNGED